METTFLDILSIAGTLVLPIILVLVPIELGERLGKAAKKRNQDLPDAPIGSLVGASLGLLAFMLAFTFQITANRFDSRKALLLDEVSSIKKAFLQAQLLPDPIRTESRDLLKEYVDLRVELAKDNSALPRVLARSEEIHKALWGKAIALSEEDRSSEIYSLFTSSLNEVIDFQNRRVVVGLQYRIPRIIMLILYFISFFSMLVLGFQFGTSGKGNILIHFALALTFAGVMWLIFALDQPEKNIIKVDQTPMIMLHKEMNG